MTSHVGIIHVGRLSDGTRARACCCCERPQLWLLLLWPFGTRPVGHEPTGYSLASRGMSTSCCTFVAERCADICTPAAVLSTAFWSRLLLGGNSSVFAGLRARLWISLSPLHDGHSCVHVLLRASCTQCKVRRWLVCHAWPQQLQFLDWTMQSGCYGSCHSKEVP